MDAINGYYAHCIQPVNSEEYWMKTDHPRPIPAPIKRLIGHPKKHRKKHGNEEPTSSHKVRKTFKVTCNTCGQVGHYFKTSKGPPVYGPPKSPRVKKSKTSNKENQPQE